MDVSHDRKLVLKFGDTVSLHHKTGVIEGQGILDEFVGLAVPSKQYTNSLFHIHVRSRIAAAGDLEEFDKKYAAEIRDRTLGEDLTSRRDALLLGRDKEEAMNHTLLEKRVGSPMVFGEPIQLHHRTSGKYLASSQEATAKSEPENFKVYLSDLPTQFSWFVMKPAEAINTEGDQVGNLSDITLSPLLCPDESVHVSSAVISKHELRRRSITMVDEEEDSVPRTIESTIKEINSSFQPSVFRVVLYSEVVKQKTCLNSGDMVFLEGPDGKSYMRAFLPSERKEYKDLEGKDFSSLSRDIVFAEKDINFEQSCAVWVVERVETQIGGALEWSMRFTCRNLNTGKYLAVCESEIDGQQGNFLCSTSDSSILEEETLVFEPASASALRKQGGEEFVNDECAVFINTHSPIHGDDGRVMYVTKQQATVQNSQYPFIAATMTPDKAHRTAIVIRRIPSASKFKHPILTGLAGRPVLRKIVHSLSNNDLETLEIDLAQAMSILMKLGQFVIEDNLEEAVSKLSHMISPIPTHQHMLSEQGVVDLLMEILEQCTSAMKKATTGTMEHRKLYRQLVNKKVFDVLVARCFQTLRLIVTGHTQNQIYVADRMAVILEYVDGEQSHDAIKVVNELLGNLDVQEDKVTEKEVEIFLRMLKAKPLNYTALRVLASICECNGTAIESNQHLLVPYFLDDDPRTLIKLVADRRSHDLSLTYPPLEAGSQGATFYMSQCVQEHEPTSPKNMRLTKFMAHQRDVTDSPDMGRPLHYNAHDEAQRSKNSGVHNFVGRPGLGPSKQQVKFLTAQILAFSAMCANRFYIAISVLKKKIPYECIVKGISNEMLDSDLRSALVCLVTTLYVDCEPQSDPVSSGMTFLWSQLGLPEHVILPKPVPCDKSVDDFRALQTVIDGQLRASGEWTTFTTNILDLLHRLVDFNFYNSSTDTLQNVVRSLLSGVEDHLNHHAVMKQKLLEKRRATTNVEGAPSVDEQWTLKGAILRHVDVKKAKRRLDSIPAMVCVLLLTFAAIFVGIVQPAEPGLFFTIFQQAVVAIFLLELLTRMTLVWDFKLFFSDPFSCVDFVVVVLDIAVFVLETAFPVPAPFHAVNDTTVSESQEGAFGGFDPKIIRALRMLRLVRAVRMFKLAIKIREEMGRAKVVTAWILSEKYTHVQKHNLKSLTNMIGVLLRIERIISQFHFVKLITSLKQVHTGEDVALNHTNIRLSSAATVFARRISSAGSKNFIKAVTPRGAGKASVTPNNDDNDGNDSKTMSTSQILEGKDITVDHFVDQLDKSHELTLNLKGTPLTELLFNMIMYEWQPLVQNAIHLLMVHHDSTRLLIENVEHFQLLSQPGDEPLFLKLERETRELLQLVEVYELWEKVETPADKKKAERAIQILEHMRDACRSPNELWLSGGNRYAIKTGVQSMLRNLGAVDISLCLRESISAWEELPNSFARRFRRLNNDFLCYFVYSNPVNQRLLFKHLHLFKDDIRSGVGSEAVITELLRDNIELIQLVPWSVMLQAVKPIQDSQQNPRLIDMLLVYVTCKGQCIRMNQIRVFQLLMSPSILPHLFLCNDTSSLDYAERNRLVTKMLADPTRDLRSPLVKKQNPGISMADMGKSRAAQGKDAHRVAAEQKDLLDKARSRGKLSSHAVSIGDVTSMDEQSAGAQSAGAQSAGAQSGKVLVLGPSDPANPQGLLKNDRAGASFKVAARQVASMVSIASYTAKQKARKVSMVQQTAVESGVGVHDGNHHLPSKMQFHIRLLELMSVCAGGKGKINIVEVKVQTLFAVDSLLEAIMDKKMCVEVRNTLVLLQYESVIDVQVLVPQMNSKVALWDLFDSFHTDIKRCVEIMSTAETMMLATRLPVAMQHELRGLMQLVYGPVCSTVRVYLETYFNMALVKIDGTGPRSEMQVVTVLSGIFHEFSRMHSLDPDYVTEVKKTNLRVCLCAMSGPLSELSGKIFPEPPLARSERRRSKRHVTPMGAGQLMCGTSFNGRTLFSASGEIMEAAASSADATNGFHAALTTLVSSGAMEAKCKEGIVLCGRSIKALKRLSDPVHDDLRFEPVICKLVSHTRSLIREGEGRKMLMPEHSTTTLWTLRLFRTMVEDEWGFSYEDRDDKGDEQSDQKAWPVQKVLNASGVTGLCLDLIAVGIDREVILEAIRVLVTLLFREGGSIEVQTSCHEHLVQAKSRLCFVKIQEILKEVVEWSVVCGHQDLVAKTAPVATNRYETSFSADGLIGGGEDGNEPVQEVEENVGARPGDEVETESAGELEELVVFRLLQLMCEGHFRPLQELMSSQVEHEQSVNLLETLVEILSTFTKIINRRSVDVLGMTLDLTLEVIQGPCVANQEYLALETELMELMNSVLRRGHAKDDKNNPLRQEDDIEAELQLKTTMLKIFKALLEGQQKPSMIFERMLSAIHMECLTLYLKVPEPDIPFAMIPDEMERAEAVDQQRQLERLKLSPMQVECLVLMQMFIDYQPGIKDEVSLSHSMQDKLGSEVVSIEVVWNHTIQRRFFHCPANCKYLSAATRDDLVQNIKRDNQDVKLQDFTRRSRIINCELHHQGDLEDLGLAVVFNRNNSNRMTWFAFYINVFVNMISIAYLQQPAEDALGTAEPQYSPAEPFGFDGANGTKILNFVQISLAVCNLVLFILVRAPVDFQACINSGRTRIMAFYLTTINGLGGGTTYYALYLVFAILGMYYPIFNAMLLFDIFVKNSTSRDVMKAVTNPVKQLAATLLLAFIFIYLSSFILFLGFRDDFPLGDCETLARCFTVTISYGLRNGGGIGDYLVEIGDSEDTRETDLETRNRAILEGGKQRFWVDVLFFFLVVIVLLNIIFGIIIDNFAELRDQKKERLRDTNEKCFICGIQRAKFDKVGGDQLWHTHIKGAHHMWNYLMFMVFVWEQDKDDDDGLEQYVRSCIESNDIAWFPDGVCMDLQEDAVVEDKVSAQTVMQREISDIKKLLFNVSETLTNGTIKTVTQPSLTNSAPAPALRDGGNSFSQDVLTASAGTPDSSEAEDADGDNTQRAVDADVDTVQRCEPERDLINHVPSLENQSGLGAVKAKGGLAPFAKLQQNKQNKQARGPSSLGPRGGPGGAVSLALAEPKGGAVKLPEGRVEPHGRGGVVKLTELVQPTDDDECADKSGLWAVL